MIAAGQALKDEIMAKLGWEPKHPDLEATLKDRYAEYCASGRDKKEMTFDLDEKVLATL